MKVSNIVKKDEKSVTISFDNGEVLFLSNEIFVKSGLRRNDEVSEGLFSSLIKENRLFHLKQKAFRYLGRRLHSVKELKTKLRQKDYDDDLIDEVINDLSGKNYLNDYEFASQFAEENIRNKLWGKAKLESELLKKGVSRNIIELVISEKLSGGNKVENAVVLIQKKIKSFNRTKLTDDKIKIKLISFLAGRGYDYDTIRQALDVYLKEN